MLPYVPNFSTINSLDCETIHKVRNNVQIVNFDIEQELWMQEGACVFADPDLFFPVGSSMKALKQNGNIEKIGNVNILSVSSIIATALTSIFADDSVSAIFMGENVL